MRRVVDTTTCLRPPALEGTLKLRRIPSQDEIRQ